MHAFTPDLQGKGKILLLWCWSVWLLVLSFMTRVTFWLFLLWGTGKGLLDTLWRTSTALLGCWHTLSSCPLAMHSWCALCLEAEVLSRWLWISYLSLPRHSGSLFSNLPKGFSCWPFMWFEERGEKCHSTLFPQIPLMYSLFLTESLGFFYPSWRFVMNQALLVDR